LKKENISDAVIRRLPRYYRQPELNCTGAGVVRISSHSLGRGAEYHGLPDPAGFQLLR
jgi:redox-sensing transcriptional repressor